MPEEAYRVLIVDDDPLQTSLIGRMLRSEGFQVQTTDSALGVTTLVRSFQPHVVLLDVRIPELSGDRLLVLLRKNPQKGTLLILHSAIDRDELRALAASVGADGWLSKNDDASGLGLRLKTIITRDLALRPQRRSQRP